MFCKHVIDMQSIAFEANNLIHNLIADSVERCASQGFIDTKTHGAKMYV